MKFVNKYISLAIFLALWEGLSRFRILDPLFFPPFSAVIESIVHMFKIGTLWPHIELSLFRALLGFFLATVIGAPLGLILGGRFKSQNDVVELPLEILSQINPFLLFHLIILFMGLGESPKVAIVAWTCLWPTLFSAFNGAANVNSSLIKSGRAFGLSTSQLIRKIIWPAAAPTVFTGLRLSLGYSLFMLIAAEMMGASGGLGFLVLRSQEAFQLDRMYAAVVVIAFLGLILDGLLYWLGRKLIFLSLESQVNPSGG
ncbi:MAG: ABC transporter permease [Deltaproteobacteria bacterium]|jgi:NitT/TauT family transport system permease protein|nr:ABC transporter permease [Deltaproteobacteria bacterium]